MQNPQDKILIGEAYYFDVVGGQIVAKGFGQFDPANYHLKAELSTTAPGTYNKLFIIIKTRSQYITPFAFYRKQLSENSVYTPAYDVRAYLKWPVNAGIESILRKSTTINILINAEHAPDTVITNVDMKNITSTITKRAVTSRICYATYRNINLTISATHSILRTNKLTISTDKSRLQPYLNYTFSHTKGSFQITDIGKILLAFQLYWISRFDNTHCFIQSVDLNGIATLHLANPFLEAVSPAKYRPSISLQDSMKPLTLIKMTHFFINPNRQKTLGSYSKIGLAFTRIIDYRFYTNSNVFHMNIANLIFALQSFAEGIAENELKKQHRKAKNETVKSIEKAIQLIQFSGDINDNVKKFYNKPTNIVYHLLTRPTFNQSLNIALEKLGIRIENYKTMLKVIQKARQQVVHSEGYDVEFLLSILTSTVSQIEIGEKDPKTKFVRIDSQLEKLYILLREMIIRYFDNYGN